MARAAAQHRRPIRFRESERFGPVTQPQVLFWPIGIVVFFGMMVAVFLTLVAVPTAYSLFARGTRSPQHVSRIVDRLMGGMASPAVQEPRRHD